jgi:hypothetical protein
MRWLIPVELDEQYGVNVHNGDIVVVNWKGKEYTLICEGWKRNPDGSIMIATNESPVKRAYFPIDAVQISLTPREARFMGIHDKPTPEPATEASEQPR